MVYYRQKKTIYISFHFIRYSIYIYIFVTPIFIFYICFTPLYFFLIFTTTIEIYSLVTKSKSYKVVHPLTKKNSCDSPGKLFFLPFPDERHEKKSFIILLFFISFPYINSLLFSSLWWISVYLTHSCFLFPHPSQAINPYEKIYNFCQWQKQNWHGSDDTIVIYYLVGQQQRSWGRDLGNVSHSLARLLSNFYSLFLYTIVCLTLYTFITIFTMNPLFLSLSFYLHPLATWPSPFVHHFYNT